ncbi:MAG: helicase HerA domain-containing protein [Candidatus Thorarchaeota archaeon]
MSSEPRDDESEREYVARVILNRGRQVDLHQYLLRHPEELLRGVLVGGSIGSGKTVRAISTIQSALDLDYGVLVFDPTNDYQRLLNHDKNGVVIDFSEFYLNPLEPPPGLSYEEWSSVFIQIFAQNFGLKDPSISILQKAMRNLLALAKPGQPPTLQELLFEVVQFKPRPRSSESSSHASVMNRLEIVLESEWGRCLNVRHGFSPEEFEEGLMVVKLRPVGIERVHELVVSLSVAKLFAYRSWMQTRGDDFEKKVLVVIEEAHRFLSEGRQGDRFGQRLYLERALVESRKLGVGFIIVDQMPHRISSYVLGSCNMWIISRLIDPKSRKMVGDALRMDVVWSNTGLLELPVGSAFIRVDHQQELERLSPMLHRDERFAYDVRGLPATVAVPLDETLLLTCIDNQTIGGMMSQNLRYRRYFRRVVEQDYQRMDNVTSNITRKAVEAFLLLEMEEAKLKDIPAEFRFECHDDVGPIVPLDKFQIEELKQEIRFLSSPVRVRLMKCLLEGEEFDISGLATCIGKDKSYISRLLSEMSKLGLVERVRKRKRSSTIFGLTKKGKAVQQWAWNSFPIHMEDAVLSNESNVHQYELEWLLLMVEKHRKLREACNIVGWRGGPSKIEELQSLEYIISYTLSKASIEGEQCLDMSLLKLISVSMESGLLAQLLLSRAPVLLKHLKAKSDVSERSIRRQLKLLEKTGVVERIRRNGEKGAMLKSQWREMLKPPFHGGHSSIHIPRRLLEKSTREAFFGTVLEGFLGGRLDQSEIERVHSICQEIVRT